jgi:hypothetical protein
MSYFDDCNHEIAQLRAAIRECYAQSIAYEEEGDIENANVYLEQAEDIHKELRAALDYREQCKESCRFDPTDLDQSYQLDVLLNELNVMSGQIEYLQDELTDSEKAVQYWKDQAIFQRTNQ